MQERSGGPRQIWNLEMIVSKVVIRFVGQQKSIACWLCERSQTRAAVYNEDTRGCHDKHRLANLTMIQIVPYPSLKHTMNLSCLGRKNNSDYFCHEGEEGPYDPNTPEYSMATLHSFWLIVPKLQSADNVIDRWGGHINSINTIHN